MSAAAPARAPRTAPRRSRSTAPRRAKQGPARRRTFAIPALAGLTESGLLVRATRSRGWIAVVTVLLIGIVALNMLALSLSANTATSTTTADRVEHDNSVLRERIARHGSAKRVQQRAAELGLQAAGAAAVDPLTAASSDAERAAERLRQGLGAG